MCDNSWLDGANKTTRALQLIVGAMTLGLLSASWLFRPRVRTPNRPPRLRRPPRTARCRLDWRWTYRSGDRPLDNHDEGPSRNCQRHVHACRSEAADRGVCFAGGFVPG